jgi:ketosteroid isomerase-like protein
MSQENVEVVRRCAECMDRRELPQAFEMLDPDVEIDLSRNVFNPDVYRGHSGVERWRDVIDEVWDDFHAMIDELIDAGDDVVTAAMIQGKGKESGVDVMMQVFQVWTLRDSKVVRLVGGYRTRADALEAVGLSEQDAQADS